MTIPIASAGSSAAPLAEMPDRDPGFLFSSRRLRVCAGARRLRWSVATSISMEA